MHLQASQGNDAPVREETAVTTAKHRSVRDALPALDTALTGVDLAEQWTATADGPGRYPRVSFTPNVARPPPGSARASSESSNRRGFLGGTSGTVTPRRRSPRSSQAARWVIDLLYGVRFNSTGSRSATGVPSASAGRNT
ncbi:putative peptidase [Mycobacteroides abscessus subsp. abscessus]|nr:putative peptidase [Mycobacteroides abscessus subsp. abscessus]